MLGGGVRMGKCGPKTDTCTRCHRERRIWWVILCAKQVNVQPNKRRHQLLNANDTDELPRVFMFALLFYCFKHTHTMACQKFLAQFSDHEVTNFLTLLSFPGTAIKNNGIAQILSNGTIQQPRKREEKRKEKKNIIKIEFSQFWVCVYFFCYAKSKQIIQISGWNIDGFSQSLQTTTKKKKLQICIWLLTTWYTTQTQTHTPHHYNEYFKVNKRHQTNTAVKKWERAGQTREFCLTATMWLAFSVICVDSTTHTFCWWWMRHTMRLNRAWFFSMLSFVITACHSLILRPPLQRPNKKECKDGKEKEEEEVEEECFGQRVKYDKIDDCWVRTR